MEYRKLIQFGKNSYVVSLPKEWLNKHKLKKGDTVYVDEGSEGLAISPKERKNIEATEITIDTTGKTVGNIQREIVAAYIKNYDSIVLVGDNLKKHMQEMRTFLHQLIGLETMEQSLTKMVAKSLVDLKSISIPLMIKRMDLIVRAMILDSKGPAIKEDVDLVYQRDFDLNRLNFLLQKSIRAAIKDPVVSRMVKRAPDQLVDDLTITSTLESIGDDIKRLFRLSYETKPSKTDLKELNKIYSNTEKAYLDVMKSYYKKNVELSEKISDICKKNLVECDEFLEENPKPGVVRMLEKLKTLQIHIRTIARLVRNS